MQTITDREAAKYAQAWHLGGYADNSPGANFVDLFFRIAQPRPSQTILDIGAGAGAASAKLSERGLRVNAFDLTDEAWSIDVPLRTGSIWRDLPRSFIGEAGSFDFGYCCDVMEHIPPQFVALSISEMLKSCRRVFYSISFKRDVHGDAMRDRLHLTIESFTWWRDTFRELGTLLEARDIIGDGVFYLER